MMPLKKFTLATLVVIGLMGCKTLTINPLRMTYTYPVAESCNYQTEIACGAVAFWNDKTIELYLPYHAKSFDKKPQRIEFEGVDESNSIWRGKISNIKNSKQDIKARFILQDDEAARAEAKGLYTPSRGMLIIEFPNETDSYKELAGKTIWLSPSVGWENVKQSYVLWQSEAKLPETIGIRFSKDQGAGAK